jgi:outer membrane protein assembly factor BamB
MAMARLVTINLIAILVASLHVVPAARADDWPQWLGPRRDGVWREEGLLSRFPREGLKIRWRAAVAGGYSGPAVANGKVYVADFTPGAEVTRPGNPYKRITQRGSERVSCFDEATGKVVWAHSYEVAYSMSYSAGPRSTPTVDGDRVYFLGGEGDLSCLDAGTGEAIWSKHLSDKASPTPTWGFASQLLIDDDRLICISGGSDPGNGRGVVTAFNKMTGAVVWSALSSKEPGYSSPVLCTSGGVRQLIVWDPDSVNSLNPQTGSAYWSQPFGPAKMGLCVVTPRFYHDAHLGDVLFVATQYEGSLVLKLDEHGPAASVLWKRVGKSDRKTDALHILLATPSIRDGHIYGVDAYGELRCLDLKTGDRLWETFDATTYDAGQQKWAAAFLIRLGDTGSRYLIANEHGDLILADLDPAGYHEISRTHLLNPTNSDPGRPVLWCHPACANRSIFWRNDKELICASMAATDDGNAGNTGHSRLP